MADANVCVTRRLGCGNGLLNAGWWVFPSLPATFASRCCVAGRLPVVIGYWSPQTDAFFCLLCSCFAVFLLVALCLAVAVPGGGGEQNAFGAFPKLHHGFVWVGQRLDLHAVHGEECGDDEVVQAFWISVFFR